MKCVLTSALLLLSFTLIGCDSNDAATDEVAEIQILPETASIPVGESFDFDVVTLTDAADTIRNADLDVRWWSSDPAVFTVDKSGRAIAHEAGTAYCMVEATTPSKVAPFTGRDSAFVTVLF